MLRILAVSLPAFFLLTCSLPSPTAPLSDPSRFVSTPTFFPIAGTYPVAQTVSIYCTTSGSTIYFTRDGSQPTTGSEVYSTPIQVSTSTVIKAIASAPGKSNSTTGYASYSISSIFSTSTPTFSPPAGTYSSAQVVTLSCSNSGAVIYYTLDKTFPSTNSAVYSNPIVVASNLTIMAFAKADGLWSSTYGSAEFALVTESPVLSPGPGTNPSPQVVTMSCSTPGANIYYTTNPMDYPTTNSTLYTSPITVSANTSFQVVAIKPGWNASPVTYGTYRIGRVVRTIAGSGTYGYVDGPSNSALFDLPKSVAADNLGNVYVADYYNHCIRKIDNSRMVSTFAGIKNDPGWTDGIGSNARFVGPVGVAVDGSNNVYVADTGNNMIRMITTAGVVSTIAGHLTASFADGFGTNAYFNGPRALAVDIYGNIYVGDSGNNRIRKIVGGVVTTIAGSATAGNLDGNGASARFNFPIGVAVDTSGNVYVADYLNHAIRKINSIGSVTTLAGSGAAAFADGTGNVASFNNPWGVAVDSSGNVFVTDSYNFRIRKVTSSGVVTTLAGGWGGPFSDGVGSWAFFNYPSGIALDSSGNLYIADSANGRIRVILP